MRIAAGVAVAILLALIPWTAARAAGDPYTPGDHGYDISWPQCGDPMPSVGSFAVIGVNGGAPFSGNLCLSDQYAAAPRSAPPSLYVNTGYEESYRYEITSGCRRVASAIASCPSRASPATARPARSSTIQRNNARIGA